MSASLDRPSLGVRQVLSTSGHLQSTSQQEQDQGQQDQGQQEQGAVNPAVTLTIIDSHPPGNPLLGGCSDSKLLAYYYRPNVWMAI